MQQLFLAFVSVLLQLLALRDVAELGQVLAQGAAEGVALGDLSLLQRYEKRQRADQERTIQFSDRVPALFMHEDPLLGLGRELALAGLDMMPVLKREFVRYAAGVGGTGGRPRG
jgi:2-octaprenyl-6-methoxyphenol hydroxylase